MSKKYIFHYCGFYKKEGSNETSYVSGILRFSSISSIDWGDEFLEELYETVISHINPNPSIGVMISSLNKLHEEEELIEREILY